MAAYRRVYERHLQADCQEPGSALEPYAQQSSMGYLYLFVHYIAFISAHGGNDKSCYALRSQMLVAVVILCESMLC